MRPRFYFILFLFWGLINDDIYDYWDTNQMVYISYTTYVKAVPRPHFHFRYHTDISAFNASQYKYHHMSDISMITLVCRVECYQVKLPKQILIVSDSSVTTCCVGM